MSHKHCKSKLVQYIIFKLHISARVSMHKADELEVNITFLHLHLYLLSR